MEVSRRSDGVFVATCATFPDLQAEGESDTEAAAALALKLRDRLVRLTGAAGGGCPERHEGLGPMLITVGAVLERMEGGTSAERWARGARPVVYYRLNRR